MLNMGGSIGEASGEKHNLFQMWALGTYLAHTSRSA